MYKSIPLKPQARPLILLASVILIITLSTMLSYTARAEGPPSMPQIFYGQVTLSGGPAPAGVSIAAKVGGTQFAATTTDSAGKYGINPVFIVAPTGTDLTIDFYINGVKADQSVTYSPGNRTELNLTIGAAPATSCGISTSSLPAGTVGTAYAASLAAAGGTTPYTWSVTSGSLPPGLTINSASGMISGTPTTAQSSSFTVQANDSASHFCSKQLSIQVNAASTSSTIVSVQSSMLGSTDVFSLSNGVLTTAKDLASADGRVKLSFSAGTAINMQGLTQLGAAVESNPPAATDNSSMVRAYSFIPSGATFSPAATLTLKYETPLPAGASESGLYLAFWTGSTWERLSSSLNTTAKEVSAPVAHFSVFSLRYLPPAAESAASTTTTTTGTTTSTSSTTSTTTTTTPTTISANVLNTISSFSISGGTVLSTTSIGSANGKLTILLVPNTAVSLPQGSQQITVIQLATPPPAPEGARMIEAYAFGPDNTAFAPAATVMVKYDPASLPSGVAEANLYIALLENSAWTPLASTVNTQGKTVSAQLSHFSTYALLGKATAATATPATTPATPTTTSAFSVSDLAASPESANPGQQVSISVRVVNGGTGEASKTVILKVNDQNEAQKDVTLAAGKSQVVSFNVSRAEPGRYTASVDGQVTSFTVKQSSGAPQGMSIPVLAVIIAGGLLVIILVIILVVRQRSGGY